MKFENAEVSVIKSKRKTISIQVKPNEVIIRAPIKMKEKDKINKDVLDELNKGCAMGMDAIRDILPKVEDAEFKSLLEDEFDKFTFFSRFVKGDLVLMQLEKGDEVHRYYIPTTATPNKAMCCGSFIDSDDRNIRFGVTKAGLKGTYDVKVIINDKKYDTGVQITC